MASFSIEKENTRLHFNVHVPKDEIKEHVEHANQGAGASADRRHPNKVAYVD